VEAYCADAGFRVPSYKELLTLVNPTGTQSTIDLTVFPNLPLGWWLWSSTRHWVGGTLVLWPFLGGGLLDSSLEEGELAQPGLLMASLHARCVR
jgi:hypothetical protein